MKYYSAWCGLAVYNKNVYLCTPIIIGGALRTPGTEC